MKRRKAERLSDSKRFKLVKVREMIIVLIFTYIASRYFSVKTQEETIYEEHFENTRNKTMDEILSRLNRIEEIVRLTTTGNLAHKKGNLLQLLYGTREILEKILKKQGELK